MSQRQVVAALNNIMQKKKKTVLFKNQFIHWLLRHYIYAYAVKLSCPNDHSLKWLVIISAF